jgi:hypothetical protein
MPLQCVFYLRIDFWLLSSNENWQHFVKDYCADMKTEIENLRFVVQGSGKGREGRSVVVQSNGKGRDGRSVVVQSSGKGREGRSVVVQSSGKGREAPSVPCAVCLRTLYCAVY